MQQEQQVMDTMDTKRQCSHLHLGNNAVGDVTFCTDCGVISVSMQYTTIRLEANAFVELAALLNASRDRLFALAQAQADELHGHAHPADLHVH